MQTGNNREEKVYSDKLYTKVGLMVQEGG